MFAVLGGDDPGHVTWAPYVFDAAKKHGLILLEDGSLVDTTRGETIPAEKAPMPPTTAEDVARHRRLTADDMADCVVRHAELEPASSAALAAPGFNECPIIGAESRHEGVSAGRMQWPHGFHVRQITIQPGAWCRPHKRDEEEVILLHKGEMRIDIAGETLTVAAGDVVTMTIGEVRRYGNESNEIVEAYIVRGSDHPGAPDFCD